MVTLAEAGNGWPNCGKLVFQKIPINRWWKKYVKKTLGPNVGISMLHHVDFVRSKVSARCMILYVMMLTALAFGYLVLRIVWRVNVLPSKLRSHIQETWLKQEFFSHCCHQEQQFKELHCPTTEPLCLCFI